MAKDNENKGSGSATQTTGQTGSANPAPARMAAARSARGRGAKVDLTGPEKVAVNVLRQIRNTAKMCLDQIKNEGMPENLSVGVLTEALNVLGRAIG